MKKDISFIIPAHNRIDLLKKTLDSVLKQKNIDTEIIVIDDASNTNIRKKLEKKYSQTIWLRNKKNLGPSACRNLGLRKATAEYICFLDSDDLLKNNFSQEMIKAAKQNNSAVLCLSKTLINKNISLANKLILEIFNYYRNFILLFLYYFNNKNLIRSAFYTSSTSRLVFPKKLILKNKFDSNLRSCEEWDLVLRILKNNKIIILPKKLLRFRFSEQSETKKQRKKNQHSSYYKMIEKLSWKEKLHPFMLIFRIYTKLISGF